MPRSRIVNSPPPAGEAALITSHDNRWLKRFRASLAGEQEHDGIVGVEGPKLVEAALSSGIAVEALLVSSSGERHLLGLKSLLAGLRILHTTDKLFAGIADTPSPQGVAALLRPKPTVLDDLVRGTALIAVLIAVQDPGNVGTILRAAEAFGATGAAACAAGQIGSANPFAPKALRASTGSALRLPILRGVSAAILFAQLRVLGVKIHAAVPGGLPDAVSLPLGENRAERMVRPWEANWKAPVAIVIGNEGAGLPPEILQTADVLVSIPQSETAARAGFESLNAAMAGTILLYEAMRQRGSATMDRNR